jgi:serpin B
MTILLPRQKDGLAALERSLTPAWLEAQTGKLATRFVAMYLPRFKVRHRLELAPVLSRLGMAAAFGKTADFSGVNGQRGLFLDLVQHEAFISVDEEGTEAAAATAISFGAEEEAPPPPKPVVFRADRPFLFLIRDRKDGLIYFIGRVVDLSA